ncbi:MAG: hypothetical protein IPN68_17865 [Bacteroidetes bacterium]|nr:hypothetical protein [Bacteroidota bacterium]
MKKLILNILFIMVGFVGVGQIAVNTNFLPNIAGHIDSRCVLTNLGDTTTISTFKYEGMLIYVAVLNKFYYYETYWRELASEALIDAYVSNNGYLTSEVDGSTSNEIQDLSGSGATLSGYQISLSSDATPVTLPNEADGSTSNELQSLSLTDSTNRVFTITLSSGGTIKFKDLDTNSGGTVTNISSGNGMNFATITGTGTVTMGTPSTLTASTTNATTSTSHTHQVTGFLTSEVDGSTSNEVQTLSADSTSTTIGITSSINNSRVHFNVLKSEVDGSITNEIQNLTYTPSTRLLDISLSATDVTLPLFSTSGSDAGLVNGGTGISAKFLRGDNTWQTVVTSDVNTTYGHSAETVTGGANIRLTGSDSSNDDIKIAGSGATTVTRTDANTITISSTDTNSGGTVTSVSGTSPIVSSGGNTPTISITLLKDLVTNAPLSGGADNILPGTDSDVTLSLDTTSTKGLSTQYDLTQIVLTDSLQYDSLLNTLTLRDGKGNYKPGRIYSYDDYTDYLLIPNARKYDIWYNQYVGLGSHSGLFYCNGDPVYGWAQISSDLWSANEIQTLTYTPSTRKLDLSATVTDPTLPLFSTSSTDAGMVNGGSGISTKFLRGDNTWQTVATSDSDAQTLAADSTSTTIGITASGSNSRVHFNVLKAEVDGSITNEIELPTQTGNSGKYLQTNGISPSWQTAISGVASSNVLPIGSGATSITTSSGTGFVKVTAGDVSYDNSSYLTSNQSISLSSDVTGTGTTTITTTIAADAVTNAKMANMAANTMKANATAGSENPTDLAITANTFPARSSTGNIAAKSITDFALTILDDATAADVRTTIGAGTGSGTVTSVASGNGMSFTTITGTGTVTMGTPSTLTDATGNQATGTTHTHAITTYSPTLSWNSSTKPIALTADGGYTLKAALNINVDTISTKGMATQYDLTQVTGLVQRDLVTTSPLSGGTDNILPGADSDVTLSIAQANTSTSGYLSNTDWNTFNNKQAALTTGNLTESITGLQFDATRQVIGGAAALSLTAGYVIPTTTEQTNWTAGYNDKIASLAFSGTSTKTLTLTQQDGGTVTGTFTDIDTDTNSGGTVTSIASGNGMNFTTITGTGTVTMGTPSTLTDATGNSATGTTHTHAITTYSPTLSWNSSTKPIALTADGGYTLKAALNINVDTISTKGMATQFDLTQVTGLVQKDLVTTSPLSGGTDNILPGADADITISIANAAADGSTKGAASFTAADFNATSGNVSIDYTNAQAASGSAKGFLTSTDWTNFDAANKTDIYQSVDLTKPDYRFKGFFTNSGTPSSYFLSGMYVGSAYVSNYGSQFGVSDNNGFYYRYLTNGTFSAWKRAVGAISPTDGAITRFNTAGDIYDSALSDDNTWVTSIRSMRINSAIPIFQLLKSSSPIYIYGDEAGILGTNPGSILHYIYGNNNYSISTDGTKRFIISGSGAITVSSLAGTGTRLATATSAGVVGNIANGTGLLYNNGSGAYTWVAGALPALTDGKIWIGNSVNAASERLLSGDATITNMGVVTVADDSHSHTSTTLPFPFARYRASDTLQVSSVVRSIKFDTESFDPTASYSVGSYEVTVPAIGYYEVQLQGMTQYGTQDPQEIEWYITVNGSAVSNSQNLQMTHFGSTRPITLTDIVYVSNASYKIGVKIKNTTNNSKYVVVKANPHLTIKKL